MLLPPTPGAWPSTPERAHQWVAGRHVALAGAMLLSLPATAAAAPWSLGVLDHSDREFDARSRRVEFAPARHGVADFPKELKLGGDGVYLELDLDAELAERGLSFELTPAWHDGRGVLFVALDVWDGQRWREAGRTPLNATCGGYVDVYAGLLHVGRAALRLRAVAGTAGTTTVTWDRILIRAAPFAKVWSLGVNDGREAELAAGGFKQVLDLRRQTAGEMPKELNTSWWPRQDLRFVLDHAQAQRGVVLNLDATWADGAGALWVRLDAWDGRAWQALGRAAVRPGAPGLITVAAHGLRPGLNDWRLIAERGDGGTTTVVWDQLALLQRHAMPGPLLALLETVLDTSLAYFTQSAAMTRSGLPMTALKVLDRRRFAYTNPTEWGYALQAVLVAVERGLFPAAAARERIARTLSTLERLQRDPEQFSAGMFYPFYELVDADGVDLPLPRRVDDPALPSGDCAILWASLNVVRGWLVERGYAAEVARVTAVMGRLSFAEALLHKGDALYLSMTVQAGTGVLSPWTWLFWADEGGVVALVAALSQSISTAQFESLVRSQVRRRRSWLVHSTAESAFFNAMFTWGQRSILGLPVLGAGPESAYGVQSMLPAIAAHLAFGRWIGVDYPAFSDAMTQTAGGKALVGGFVPPNQEGFEDAWPPEHITPHALAVPFAVVDALDEGVLRELFDKLMQLQSDASGVWHPKGTADPYGFEVIASPYLNIDDYPGADDGRYIFETLSQAYTVLSIYEGLTRLSNGRTLGYFAAQSPGFAEALARLLGVAYSER